jgi:hypothetical protein
MLLAAATCAPCGAGAQEPADAYVNDDARTLVRLARLRRNTVDRRIEAYGTTARERFSVGLHAGIGEKLVYRRETVTRIDWQRDGPVALDVLAMREVSPLFDAEPEVPLDMSAELLRLAFDPVESEMLLRFDTTGIRHPLTEGSEAQYRFEAGDTTVIRLPDGRAVRLRELRFIPRRRDPHLIHGSFWLEAETHAVVQAYFKLAQPFDADREGANMVVVTREPDTASARTDDGVITAADLPGFLKPLRADLDLVAIEYGLWDLEWWLPRLIVARGVAQINRFRIPLSYERTYEAYTVRGDTAGALSPRPDSLPRPCRVHVRFAASPDPVRDSVRQARTDAERTRRQRWAQEGRRIRGDSATVIECTREFIIAALSDSVLLHGPELPPTPYAGDVELISDADLRAIRDRVASAAGIPWSAEPPRFQWGLLGPGLVRYNRIEGLSLGARLLFDVGAMTLKTEARLGIADLDPRGEVALDRPGYTFHTRFAAYRRLQPATPSSGTHGTLASLGALLLARDDDEYFDALGGELVVRPPESRTQWYDLRLYAERQRAVDRNTDFSIAHLINSSNAFRDNFTADPVEQFGARVRLRAALGLNPAAPRIAGELSLGAETGDYAILRPEALVRATTPLPFDLELGLEGAAGTVEGSAIPAQALWRLGGASTLRGYSGGALTGERYWRARADLGWGVQGARLTLFSDAAWAGPRNRFDGAGTLPSVGAGVSLLDGLFRIDLARGLDAPHGWRLNLYWRW